MKNKIKILFGLFTFVLIAGALVMSNQGHAVTVTISILAEEFDPEIITINVGDSVTWTNNSTSNKHVASDPHPSHTALPGLNSGVLSPGQSFSYTFTQIGEFGFHDHFNYESGGIVIVEAAPSPSPAPSPTPSPTPTPTPTPSPSPSPTPTPGGGSGGPTPTPSPAPAPSPTPAPGPSPYLDGTLILDNGTIYIIEFGKKRPFATMAVFTGLGYKFQYVINASTTNISLGDGIFDPSKRHVRGAVVVHNGTVYFLGAAHRYGFPSAEVFLSWGLKFAEVVPANAADVTLPEGPLMHKKP